MTAAEHRDDLLADRRRTLRHTRGNGLDAVEIGEGGRHLVLMFLEQPPTLSPGNIRIVGPSGQPAVTPVGVWLVTQDDPQLSDHLVVELDRPGGEGSYQLKLVESRPDGRPSRVPLRGLDPCFTESSFVFDIDQPNPVIGVPPPSPAPPTGAPANAYLARDYQGLRRLLLDRLARTIPGWTERHVPDLMVTLVEMFAYLGDELSYHQDAVATEAYLQTARQRVSMRRHGRLVGYRMHDGCHARAWLSLTVQADVELDAASVSFSTADNHVFVPLPIVLPGAVSPSQPPDPTPAGKLQLRAAHNGIALWNWGETHYTLDAGATSATLQEPPGEYRSLELQPGSVLMFEERQSAHRRPPNPAHRHPVRITRVHRAVDPLYDQPVVEVHWALADALPFSLPVTTYDPAQRKPVACSVAWGNVILVGQGVVVPPQASPPHHTLGATDLTWSVPFPDPERVAHHQALRLRHLYRDWRTQLERWWRDTLYGEPLDTRQRQQLRQQLGAAVVEEFGLDGAATNPDERAERDALGLLLVLVSGDDLLATRRRRLRVLSQLAVASGPLHGPLLQEVAEDWGNELAGALSAHDPASWGPAADATKQDPRAAEPVLRLTEQSVLDDAPQWTVTTGLVDASPDEPRALVEIDDNNIAHLRFNPSTTPHSALSATCLVGNGSAGNVAADTITEINAPGGDAAIAAVRSVRNPLPATGGTDPEPIEEARRAIPGAYLVDQPRAITPADYAALAERVAGVRRAAATLRWTGNRLAVRVAVQPTNAEDPDGDLLHLVEQELRPARRIGHDLWIVAPTYRAVLVAVTVALEADAIRDDVRAALTVLLSSSRLRDGGPALFHPENLGFGTTVYASSIIAAVQEQPEVLSVVLTQFGFLSASVSPATPQSDRLTVGPTEIARLDNDPTRPAHGYARIELRGGR